MKYMSMVKFLGCIAVLIICFMNCSSKKAIVENENQRPQTVDILIKYGLNGIKVNYDMVQMESTDTDDMYTYLDGLDLAIESFLTDRTHPESPLGIVPDAVDAYRGNASKPQQELEKLLELINAGGSLCMPDIDGASDQCFHAEEGEDEERNWIFLLQVPELSDYHFWAIVPKDGKEAVYNYGFN